jgi:hypothetical protein
MRPMTYSHVGALLRFWWLVLLGIASGILVATVLVYRVEVGWPPKFPPELTERTPTSYQASTELLVDSPTGPYLQAGVGIAPPATVVPGRPQQGRTQPAVTEAESSVITNRRALVEAANLFPLLIESDEVSAIRARRMGVVPGQVRARALYSTQGENRFRPSVLPVIQIAAVAPSPAAAIRLTQGTANAFKVWLASQQQQAGVPRLQRVVIRQLRVPRSAFATGGSSYGLPLLAAAAVMFGFAGMAVLLDRSFPRGPAALERIAALVEVTDANHERTERASRAAR